MGGEEEAGEEKDDSESGKPLEIETEGGEVAREAGEDGVGEVNGNVP